MTSGPVTKIDLGKKRLFTAMHDHPRTNPYVHVRLTDVETDERVQIGVTYEPMVELIEALIDSLGDEAPDSKRKIENGLTDRTILIAPYPSIGEVLIGFEDVPYDKRVTTCAPFAKIVEIIEALISYAEAQARSSRETY